MPDTQDDVTIFPIQNLNQSPGRIDGAYYSRNR